jgi:hypothetical protein
MPIICNRLFGSTAEYNTHAHTVPVAYGKRRTSQELALRDAYQYDRDCVSSHIDHS